MAVKFEFTSNKNHAYLELKAMQKLEFKEDSNNGFVKYGKDNLYPQELIRLYNDHPEHRAIINRKARYVWGKGLKAVNKEDEVKVNAFIDTFNRKEDLNKVGKKITPNTEIFNGCYIEVITNLSGKPIEFYLLNSANCRVSECETKLYFCKDWKKNTRPADVKVINKYEPNGKAGTFFVEFKYYTPQGNKLSSVYPTAQYQSIVGDINTDIDISTFNSMYVSNGFSVGTIISFFNGVPDAPMQSEIDRRFKGTYGGELGESVMITHADRDDKAPQVIDVSIQDLAEKFAFTSKRAQKKIFAGHEMASELFNIKFEDSFLSGSPDLLTLQELFVKGYVEPRQTELLEFLSYLSYLKTGEYLKMEFEPISLIGADLSNDVDLTQDERRKLKGYAPLIAPKLDANGQPLPVQASEVNDNLKGLSASENRDMQRVVRDYQAKKNGMNEHMAISRLTAYGLSTDEAKKILGINAEPNIKLNSQVDKVLMALEACAEDDNDDEIVLTEFAHIHNSKDALKYERHLMKFANEIIITATELDSAVLNALKGNPQLTIDELATITDFENYKVEESISRLVKKGFLEDSFDGFKPTTKAIEKPTEPTVSTQVYTVYKYALKEGVDYSNNPNKISKDLLSTSHAFCKKMIGLTNLGKHWSFESIDKVSNDFGMNAWDYKGGFTNKDGVIDPDCNHYWYAITKKRTIVK